MLKSLKNFNLKGKRVLVRCDFNVPVSEKGEILSDFRIKASLPTIEYLLENEAKIILMSHWGRPEGKVVENLRLTPIQERLIEYLDVSVTKAPDCIGKGIEEWTKEMVEGEILLLENLRFHKEEENNDPVFAKKLASLGDFYVNDAFSVCHRKHASVVGIPKYLPAAAGFRLEKEVRVLTHLLKEPARPLVVIIGGVKVEDKAKVIDSFLKKADYILTGNIIASKISSFKAIKPVDGGRDLGEKTIKIYEDIIKKAKTIFWAGPLGEIERKEYQKGSLAIAKAIIKSGAFSVVGGGETVSFLNSLNLGRKFNHLSTGGGAMLKFLAGEELPGLKVLQE